MRLVGLSRFPSDDANAKPHVYGQNNGFFKRGDNIGWCSQNGGWLAWEIAVSKLFAVVIVTIAISTPAVAGSGHPGGAGGHPGGPGTKSSTPPSGPSSAGKPIKCQAGGAGCQRQH